jgi:glycosyltransferase involved in cell wall biosynthesis
MRDLGCEVDSEEFYFQKKTGFLHREFNISLDYKIIGNISSLRNVQSHYVWIDAVEDLCKRGFKAKYVLITDGSLEPEIKKYVKSKGLENEIIFAGSHNDVYQCIPEFDLFLFTSKIEDTTRSIFESFVRRTPIVGNRTGGLPTVLANEETGLMAELESAADFANKIAYLIKLQTL